MELFRALGALTEPPGETQRRVAAALELPAPPDPAAYTDLFVFQLQPYASVYLGAEGMLGGEARDRVAGFWRALKLDPPSEPDHLATLLALHASLAEQEAGERDEARRRLVARARSTLLWEHLLSWLPVYLAKAKAIADGCYRAWAALLDDALRHELEECEPLDRLPSHLRAAPPMLPDPRVDGFDRFLAGLLTPAGSGMILVRDDLARAARELGLGLRHGERRHVIRALISQEPDAMLGWLEREARTWVERHRAAIPGTPAIIRDFWESRAAATADLLTALRPSHSSTVNTV